MQIIIIIPPPAVTKWIPPAPHQLQPITLLDNSKYRACPCLGVTYYKQGNTACLSSHPPFHQTRGNTRPNLVSCIVSRYNSATQRKTMVNIVMVACFTGFLYLKIKWNSRLYMANFTQLSRILKVRNITEHEFKSFLQVFMASWEPSINTETKHWQKMDIFKAFRGQ